MGSNVTTLTTSAATGSGSALSITYETTVITYNAANLITLTLGGSVIYAVAQATGS